MQVQKSQRRETRLGLEGLTHLGVGLRRPLPPGRLTQAILEPKLALPPEEAGSLLCDNWCLASPMQGSSAWGLLG